MKMASVPSADTRKGSKGQSLLQILLSMMAAEKQPADRPAAFLFGIEPTIQEALKQFVQSKRFLSVDHGDAKRRKFCVSSVFKR